MDRLFFGLLHLTLKDARRQADYVSCCLRGSFVQIYVFILNVDSPAYEHPMLCATVYCPVKIIGMVLIMLFLSKIERL